MSEKEPFSEVKFFCLDSPAFEKLVDKLVDYVKENHTIKDEPWVKEEDAHDILGLTSKATYQKLRDNNEVEFSQPTLKHIMYKRESLYKYLEKHSNRKK